ncbi:hypothetical protein CROQUDRAFT_89063 [Cronartium quercuum f. sp. fusiforme G11]|uniref:RING-type E3 ubiquitin transferase n=1 Tax=Cronartium quercuum f. sp. fusiforme G11 TaxID=708437 RepID=A0A9P6TEL4_9BASI|nr:hypothetical protein CROQUDRAFT_89063 [Cronartium quercuum f. sp. fusiforme G11]
MEQANSQSELQSILEWFQWIRNIAHTLTNNANGAPARAFLELLLRLFEVESVIVDIEESENDETDEVEVATWQEACETQKFLQALIIQTSHQFCPEAPMTSEDFLEPGSEEWRRMYAFTKLGCESTFVVRGEASALSSEIKTEVEDPSEKSKTKTKLFTQVTIDEECSVCLEKYSDGDCVVQLPCHHNHQIHYDCLKAMSEASEVKFLCPLCRGSLMPTD